MSQFNHTLGLVGLAVLIVCAGCSGIPTDDRAQGPSDLSVASITYPDGWTPDAVDPSTALRTHRQTLTDRPRQSRVEIVDTDGDNRTVIRAVDPETQTASLRFVDTTFSTDIETYYTTDRTYEYDHTTETVTDSRNATWNATTVGFQADNTIRRPLNNLDLEASDVVRVDGSPAINYSVNGLEDPSRTPPNAASGHVVVSERGYIVVFDIRKSNDDYSRRYTYDLTTGESISVSEPAWLPTG